MLWGIEERLAWINDTNTSSSRIQPPQASYDLQKTRGLHATCFPSKIEMYLIDCLGTEPEEARKQLHEITCENQKRLASQKEQNPHQKQKGGWEKHCLVLCILDELHVEHDEELKAIKEMGHLIWTDEAKQHHTDGTKKTKAATGKLASKFTICLRLTLDKPLDSTDSTKIELERPVFATEHLNQLIAIQWLSKHDSVAKLPEALQQTIGFSPGSADEVCCKPHKLLSKLRAVREKVLIRCWEVNQKRRVLVHWGRLTTSSTGCKEELKPSELEPDLDWILKSIGLLKKAKNVTAGTKEAWENLLRRRPELDPARTPPPPACIDHDRPALNHSQLAALSSSMDACLSTIQGPPGSGKSKVISRMANNAIMNGTYLVVATQNNRALNAVLERMTADGVIRHLGDCVVLQNVSRLGDCPQALEFTVRQQIFNDLKRKWWGALASAHIGMCKLYSLIVQLPESKSKNRSDVEPQGLWCDKMVNHPSFTKWLNKWSDVGAKWSDVDVYWFDVCEGEQPDFEHKVHNNKSKPRCLSQDKTASIIRMFVALRSLEFREPCRQLQKLFAAQKLFKTLCAHGLEDDVLKQGNGSNKIVQHKIVQHVINAMLARDMMTPYVSRHAVIASDEPLPDVAPTARPNDKYAKLRRDIETIRVAFCDIFSFKDAPRILLCTVASSWRLESMPRFMQDSLNNRVTVVLDEAGSAPERAILPLLRRAAALHLVLIGDPKQLPPYSGTSHTEQTTDWDDNLLLEYKSWIKNELDWLTEEWKRDWKPRCPQPGKKPQCTVLAPSGASGEEHVEASPSGQEHAQCTKCGSSAMPDVLCNGYSICSECYGAESNQEPQALQEDVLTLLGRVKMELDEGQIADAKRTLSMVKKSYWKSVKKLSWHLVRNDPPTGHQLADFGSNLERLLQSLFVLPESFVTLSALSKYHTPDKNPVGPHKMLEIGYRMPPPICELVSTVFYGSKFTCSPETTQKFEARRRQGTEEQIRGHCIELVDCRRGQCCKNELGSWKNDTEVQAVVDIYQQILQMERNHDPDHRNTIMIITFYRAQCDKLRDELPCCETTLGFGV